MPHQNKRNRAAIRVGLRVIERLEEAQNGSALTVPEAEWEQCRRLARLVNTATVSGWHGAAGQLHPSLTRAICELRDALDRVHSEHLAWTPPSCPTIKEVYAELQDLFDEFPNTEIDLRGESLSVTTDSIILDDIYLGPFRIELDLERGGVGLAYSIIAVDPCPAASNEEVTHPHVQNGELCEGEGRMPIRNALQEGRLCDFFQIVAQILETYNPASPYVALDEWGGISCVDCGRSTSEDERTHCASSDETICYDCAMTCSDCDRDFSSDFINRCDKCGERYCIRCFAGDICDACQKEDEQEEISTAPIPTEAGPGGSCGEPFPYVASGEPVAAVNR